MQNYKNSGKYKWLALLNKMKKLIISLFLHQSINPHSDFEPFKPWV